MKRITITLSLIAAVMLSGFLLITAVIAPTLATTYAQVEAAPASAFDMVMKSRQTPVIQTQAVGGGWSTVLAVLMVLAIVAGIIYTVSKGGGEALRQWRLTFKKRHMPVTTAIQSDMSKISEAEWNLIQTARRAHGVPKLEAVNEQNNHSD